MCESVRGCEQRRVSDEYQVESIYIVIPIDFLACRLLMEFWSSVFVLIKSSIKRLD